MENELFQASQQQLTYRGHYHRRVAEQEEEFVVRCLSPRQERVLEMGAGSGRVTRHLQVLAEHVTACEIDEAMLEPLQRRLGGAENVTFCPATFDDFDKIPHRGLYSAAVALRVLPYVSDWREAVRKLCRALRPEGLVLFDLWNSQSFEYRLMQWAGFQDPVPTHRLDREGIRHALDNLPLEFVTSYRWGYPRLGAFSSDWIGEWLCPNSAYSTVFCCRVK